MPTTTARPNPGRTTTRTVSGLPGDVSAALGRLHDAGLLVAMTPPRPVPGHTGAVAVDVTLRRPVAPAHPPRPVAPAPAPQPALTRRRFVIAMGTVAVVLATVLAGMVWLAVQLASALPSVLGVLGLLAVVTVALTRGGSGKSGKAKHCPGCPK